jgi:hypothetical protein
VSQPQPPSDPEGQQPYPDGQYEPSGTQPPQDPRQPPPGWYADPGGQQVLRWWDGTAWAPHTQPLPQPGMAPPGAGVGPGGPPLPAGRRSPQGGGSHWVRNILAGIGAVVVIGIVISVLSHTSSGGNGSTNVAGSPSAAAGSPSAPPCTTNACIADDIQHGLVGAVAKDNAVITKVTCKASTVKGNAGSTWTASCKVTESDGSVSTGFGNLVMSTDSVTYEPQDILNP